MGKFFLGFVGGILVASMLVVGYMIYTGDFQFGNSDSASETLIQQPTSLTTLSTPIIVTSAPIRPTTISATQTNIPIRPTTQPVTQTNVAITPNIAPDDVVFQELLANVNALRRSVGAGELTIDARLNDAAAIQADYNARIESLTHDGEFGASVADRVEAQGYVWSAVGENLLMNWDLDGDVAFQQWENSPGHYANMVNPAYTQVGMAYVLKPTRQNYQAMVFGTPR